MVVSRRQMNFQKLNRLYRRGNSLGFIERQLALVLIGAIIPDPESHDWAGYLRAYGDDYYILPSAWAEVVERLQLNGVEMEQFSRIGLSTYS